MPRQSDWICRPRVCKRNGVPCIGECMVGIFESLHFNGHWWMCECRRECISMPTWTGCGTLEERHWEHKDFLNPVNRFIMTNL